MAFPTNLRYSPYNWLIIDWSFNGQRFADCGLPKAPDCPEETEDSPAPCRALPIQEAIDTYDWARWLPEIIVGIEDPDEQIAGHYAREAAIEFCKDARVLQREVVVELQPGVSTYPVFPYEGEQIIGVIAIHTPTGTCGCSGTQISGYDGSIEWTLDVARNELHLNGAPANGLVALLVYSAPTEDSCAHDVFLYDRFRADITLGARRNYANAVHFRDRALMASLPSPDAWVRAKLLAKTKAVRGAPSTKMQPGSGMWGARCPNKSFNGRYFDDRR
jgi:hypothetical protein